MYLYGGKARYREDERAQLYGMRVESGEWRSGTAMYGVVIGHVIIWHTYAYYLSQFIPNSKG